MGFIYVVKNFYISFLEYILFFYRMKIFKLEKRIIELVRVEFRFFFMGVLFDLRIRINFGSFLDVLYIVVKRKFIFT